MKYAIVESGGKQFRAVEGDTIEVDRLPNEIGTNVKLEQILLIADGENISVGSPLLKDSPVWTTVLEHFRGRKVTTFNYSPKKRIRVKTGHRQNYTRLLIEQVGGSDFVKKEPVEKAKKIAAAEVEEASVEKKPAKKPAAEKKAPAKAAGKASPSKASSTKKASEAGATKAAPKKTTPKAAPKKTAEKK
jgi:large subunit ribosomal protein L21